jgi:hypothetical protein
LFQVVLTEKLHPDTVAGGLFDSEVALSTSIINEYLSLYSQPVDGSHNVKGGSFNEKAKLKISTRPEEINSFVEGQQDPCQSGSNYMSSKVNVTEISQAFLIIRKFQLLLDSMNLLLCCHCLLLKFLNRQLILRK